MLNTTSTIFRLAILALALGFPVTVLAQTTPPEIPLWPKGAPGFEDRRNEPEQAEDYWVRHINNPSITVYLPPKDKATGAAVVICPGGGHRELVFNAEGRQPAQYLNSIGVTAFVLKYRLASEVNSPYSLDKHTREDAYRAMRLVRSKANEFGIDPNRLGMLGFSAGGDVVSLVAYTPGKGPIDAPDPIDRLDGRPSFQMLIYPGPLGLPKSVPADAPPAFLLVANDDLWCSEVVVMLLQKYRAAKLPIEVHIYAQGKHAFNMGDRSELKSIHSWPQRMADWLSDNHFLEPSTSR